MCHVLVIEDEPLIAMHVADIAGMRGTSTELAEFKEAALIAARHMMPAVIVSDVDLKQGGRGPIAVATIRNELGPVPVIFVTGTPEDCEPCDYAHLAATPNHSQRATAFSSSTHGRQRLTGAISSAITAKSQISSETSASPSISRQIECCYRGKGCSQSGTDGTSECSTTSHPHANETALRHYPSASC